MATLNIVLDTRRQKAGKKYPLKARINHLKKSTYLSLDIDLDTREWDRKKQRVRPSHSLHRKLNLKIASVLTGLQEVILDLEKAERPYSAKSIKEKYFGNALPEDVLTYGEYQISQLQEARKFGTARTYRDSLRKLSVFLDGQDCRFEDLDYTMLTQFQSSMLKEGLKVNTISVYLRSIRAIYNKAIRDGVASRIHYPFHDFKIKSEKTRSRSLTIEELKRLIDHPIPEDSAMWQYRQLFLLSFAFIGMNFVDMAFLTAQNIDKGRVNYRRRKTGKLYSIGLNKYNQEVLHGLMNGGVDGDGYLLPIIQGQQASEKAKIEYAREVYRRCNKNLKLIAKKAGMEHSLSTYWARYSWANIARKLGYSKDMIAEALGHSYGNKVTSIYLDDYSSEVIDEMNFRVLRQVLDNI